MSWSIGYDNNWNRDIGYGVPAICDYPGCDKKVVDYSFAVNIRNIVLRE